MTTIFLTSASSPVTGWPILPVSNVDSDDDSVSSLWM